jgi:hypothetical protein
MRTIAAACLAAAVLSTPTQVPSGSAALPPGVERAYSALAGRFDREGALEIVRFMDQYWRLAGNPGYNASIDRIKSALLSAGFVEALSGSSAIYRVGVDEFPNSSRGWDYRIGTVAFDGVSEAPLLSREVDRVSLAINSFSTSEDGIRAPLVDVGDGAEADFAGKDVRGAVVLGDRGLGALWVEAVKKRGAAGVVSTAIASYIRPSDPKLMSPEQQDVLQWGSIPYDAAAKSFGFKASWRAASRMRERLRKGPVMLRVTIQSMFYDGPNRSLVAEIIGRSRPGERIVMVAHVQEPGANDDASGCGTLYGLVRALADAVRSGALSRPERTLTFMWLDEVRGSRQWIASHPEAAKGVQYMFSMDMTGEDTAKTGGTFLIEKQADPSAVWARPSDPHSEWGAGDVKAADLKGSLLNDLHLAVCRRRARDTGWIVRTNPYEGGSDHTAFAAAGVPSLLNWHFTDRYYHTNQDRPDKTSAVEMEHVGIAVATSSWFLASASASDAVAVADLIESAALARLTLEREQGKTLVAKAANRAAAEAVEAAVITAWIKWYGEALDSVLRLAPSGPDERALARVAAARSRLAPSPLKTP